MKNKVMTTVNIDLKTFNEETGKETVKQVPVLLKESNPFQVTDVFSDNTAKKGRNIDYGSLIQDLIDSQLVIMSPKDICSQIEDADNSVEAISQLFNYINQFCMSPKRFIFEQKKSKKSKDVLGIGTKEPDADGDKKSK